MKSIMRDVNSIVVIGYTGIKRCYLNYEQSDAINEYCSEEGITHEEFTNDKIPVRVIWFTDTFLSYDVWV